MIKLDREIGERAYDPAHMAKVLRSLPKVSPCILEHLLTWSGTYPTDDKF